MILTDVLTLSHRVANGVSDLAAQIALVRDPPRRNLLRQFFARYFSGSEAGVVMPYGALSHSETPVNSTNRW